MIVMLVTLTPAAMSAQTPAELWPVRLSLNQAKQLAAEHNPAYRQALNDVDVAEARTLQGWGAFLPRLTAGMSYNGRRIRTVAGIGDFGDVVFLEEPQTLVRSGMSQWARLSLTLFDGGGRVNELAEAQAHMRAVEARASAELQRLRAEVARRYYEALRAARLLNLEERLLASARERLEATKAMLRVAARGPADVLGARVDVSRQRQSVAQARGALRKAKLRLLETLGVRSDSINAIELTSQPPPVFDPAMLNADALVQRALESNPRVVRWRAAARAAAQAVDAAQAARWPTIEASVRYTRSLDQGGYGAIANLDLPNTSFSFGLSTTFNLFSQFQTFARVAQSEAAYADAQQDLRRARLAVEREVRSALVDLENAYTSLQIARQSADLARERVEMAREQYRLGALSFTALQNIIDQAARAERQVVRARFGFATALATLEEKVGGTIEVSR